MTTPDIDAALAAICRLDDDAAEPGDEALAATFDRHASAEFEALAAQAHADWWAIQAPIWGDGEGAER